MSGALWVTTGTRISGPNYAAILLKDRETGRRFGVQLSLTSLSPRDGAHHRRVQACRDYAEAYETLVAFCHVHAAYAAAVRASRPAKEER